MLEIKKLKIKDDYFEIATWAKHENHLGRFLYIQLNLLQAF
jgi:hypothetical protein